MTRRSIVWLAGVLWTASVVLGGSLDAPLERLIADSKLADKVGLSVMILDAGTGQPLASYDPTRRMIPASNMKLLTTGSALGVLGPDFVFETHIDIADGGKRVIVRGAGDPAFADPDLLRLMDRGVEDLLESIVAALMRGGADSPNEIIVDDRVFDREYVHPTWPESQLNRRYCAEVCGLNFYRNVIGIYPKPTEQGRPPTLTLAPAAPWIEVNNRARTVGRGRQHTAWASRKHGTNDIGLHGDVRYDNRVVEVTLNDNATQFGLVLADRLRAAGGSPGEVRLAGEDEELAEGTTVHIVRTTIETVVKRCHVDSQNLYAESLLKRIGHAVTGDPGSWANGAAVVRMELAERLGPSSGAEVIVADGSGMSRENRVTTDALARWLLNLARDEEAADIFVSTLPLAGKEGTLKKRFKNAWPTNPVRAKTGYLSGVTAMSGYVMGEDGEPHAIFSIISNDKPNSVPLKRVRELEEKIVLMVDEWVSTQEEAGVDLGG